MPLPSASECYDWWAEAYDECNSENDYELWVGAILLPELEQLGLRRGWALDLGCGTGLAFPPLLERGWNLVGCDASPGMLKAASRKFGDDVELLKLDVRALPSIDPQCGQLAEQGFHLVLMLNDVVNYLTDIGDLERAFSGIKRNLHAGGLALFDANTLALFRRDYIQGVNERIGTQGWRWQGLSREGHSGQIFEGVLEDPRGLFQPHCQRHWSRHQIQASLTASGLKCLAVLGQREMAGEINLNTEPSETSDQKFIYIAGHP